MAGATNTIIQILRSDTTAYPTTLNPGEQAYSFVSDKLFIGNTSSGVVTIGGEYYVNLIDGATSSNSSNTLVRRDDSGNVALNMATVLLDASGSTDVVNKNYLDNRINALSANTIYSGVLGQDGYSNVHVSNTAGGGQVIIVANNATVATLTKTTASFVQDVMVSGNLTVKGATSYTNVETLLVDNNEIVMNANASGSPLINAFITVNRGAADNAAIIWNEATDTWQLDSAVGTNYDIVHTGGGQNISGKTSFNEVEVQNLSTLYSLSVQSTANVQSLTANGTIYADQVVVAANVQLANVANVAYFVNVTDASYAATYKHKLLIGDGASGNVAVQANTLLLFDSANTTLSVGYSHRF